MSSPTPLSPVSVERTYHLQDMQKAFTEDFPGYMSEDWAEILALFQPAESGETR